MPGLNFSAVIFDLDGVITDTASVHSEAWKIMFDEFLIKYANRKKESFRAFDHEQDYLPYVDGKPRYEGVMSFLESRNITLPYGNPDDNPDIETICGLGNRKNYIFNQIIISGNVKVFKTTVNLIRELKKNGIRIGVGSSSKNCEIVLDVVGLLPLFDTIIDGVVSTKIGLKGKPEPDIFITACNSLGVPCKQAVIFEDAVSGVQAGKKAGVGLVIGVAREINHDELTESGADIVIHDVGEVDIYQINQWFLAYK